MRHIVQVVPRLPPLVDGVGDYALNLALRLRKDHGLETHFVAGDEVWDGPEHLEGFKISSVTRRSPGNLLSLLPNENQVSCVLLHYVGYGYSKRGCPRWLVEGLEHWKKEYPRRSIIAMFHEIYASGPFWTSSFWLSSTQRNLAARLAFISSQIVTNREQHTEILKRLVRNSHQQIYVLPVFSNVGEPEQTPLPLTKRRRRLVVFGNRGHRSTVFRNCLVALKRVCRALNIEEVLDIGAPVEHGITEIDGISITRTGVQPAHRVSELLSDAVVGFFNYPTYYLGKSTIFAAYCAHRVLPIGVSYNARSADGLECNRHFQLADQQDKELSLADGQFVADNAYAWYQSHSLSVQAKVFASCLMNPTN